MPLPNGISTCVVTFGRATSYLGNDATITGTLSADRTVIHAASGVRIGSGDDVVPNDAGFLSFPVPHVDQSGFVDGSGNAVTGWLYILNWSIRYDNGKVESNKQVFQVLVGQTSVDLDLVPNGPVVPTFTAPTGVVTSVNGETGAVTVEGGSGGAGLPKNFTTRTTTYTAAAGDFVRADTTGGGFTVTLPTTPAVGALVAAQKIDASGNVLTVAPAGGGTINGDPNATVVSRYAGAVLEHVGSNAWVVVSLFSTTGPQGEEGPAGPAGTGGVNPAQAAGVVGRWYLASSFTAKGIVNRSVPLGTFILGAPVIAQTDLTINQLGVYVQTAGGVGALLRLGIYLPTNQAAPYEVALNSPYATLLAGSDTGTTPSSGDALTQGRTKFTLSSPITIEEGTAFCVGFAVQGAGPVGVYCEDISATVGGTPWGSGDILDGVTGAVLRTDITGALPATFTPTAFQASGFGGACHYRRSA